MIDAAQTLAPPPAEIHEGGCPRCRHEEATTLFRGTDRLYATTQRSFSVVECVRCGMMRLDPPPHPDELAGFYPQTYWWQADESAAGRLAELYRQLVLADHVRFAMGAVDGAGPVLDIGCGGGSFLNALGKRGVGGAGADTSAKAAEVCWSQYGIPAVNASLPYLPFTHGAFQTVTMFHVLEHLPDPMMTLEAIWDLLPPGGRLVLQVPNAACWQVLLLGERWSGFDVPRHLINFREEDLVDLLSACGFEVERTKHFSLRDNPAGLATSLCPQLEPVSRKVRQVPESRLSELGKNLLYLGLVAASTPFALLEAAGCAGSTIMVDAARRADG